MNAPSARERDQLMVPRLTGAAWRHAPGREPTGPETAAAVAELREIAARLTVIEARVSDQRRTLHERIDALQAELVDRHKTGRASVDGLLS